MRLISLLAVFVPVLFAKAELPAGIRFQQGASNVVIVGTDTSIYGVPAGANAGANKVRQVLLTHARRDAISGIEESSDATLQFVVPAADRELFENPDRFWAALDTERFHDYAQRDTKVPTQAIRVERGVSDGDVLEDSDKRIEVVSTPGYTRGAVSYVFEAGGKRIACTGDLIYGDGQIFDLYSLQDAVPEAKARGYHGYAARAVDLIRSLRKVAALKPDLILPARGPAIQDPAAAISRLIERLQTFLESHFEVDALRWYWGDDNLKIRSQAVERPMQIMPMGEQAALPSDILAIGNSRLIVSRTGAAFLVDAGYDKLLPELQRLRAAGTIKRLEGVWITHYHDDHTDYVNEVTAEFPAPVYFTEEMAGVLAHPDAYRLPCLTSKPIPVNGKKRDGETLRWKEWEFTFWYFPGQTLYHGGLVARRDDGETILFAGDSFTPSGMDDYCMQNRDLLGRGPGYEYCLRKIATLKDPWIVNQHVAPMFRFTGAQLTRMQSELVKRSAVLKELSPWPDINYMVDESWARIYPYGSEAKAGDIVALQLRIRNHAPGRLTYRVKWNQPAGWQLMEAQDSIDIAGGQEKSISGRFRAGSPGLAVITADVSFAGRRLSRWTEALVRVH